MKSIGTTDAARFLQPSTIRVGLPGTTKEEVIGELIDLLDGHPAVQDLSRVREAVLGREAVMSTGVGKNLGLPHAKTSAVSETVAAFAVTQQPIDFDAIDDEPVRLVFLLVGTEAAKSEHIKILSRLSRLMNRDAFRRRLLSAATAEEVLSIFQEGEAVIAER